MFSRDEITAEDEAMFDIQIAEQEWDDWLASWIDDFWSDEWAEAIDGL